MSKGKMQKSEQEGLHDEMPDKSPWWKNRKRVVLAVIAVICALLGVGVWLLVMSGHPDGSVPCVEDGCGGYYINGICSKDSTHCEPAAENGGYYEITNAGQFLWFGAKVNAGENGIKGRLMNDIDLESHVWTPIGSSASPFEGTFDGGGYTINNLNVQNENTCGGLFGHVTGIVRNFTVHGEIIMAAQTGDQTEGQGLIGYASGATIGRIESYVNITAGSGVTEVGYVGGIVGDMSESTISQSIWYGTINMDGANAAAVGGIAGHIADEGAVSIADCAGYGTVKSSANGRPVMGGLVGYVNNHSAALHNCVFAGEFNLMRGARETYVSAIGKLDAVSPATGALYYLQDSAPSAWIGDAGLDEDALIVVSAEELGSGKVALLLNGYTSGGLWKQTIGKDAYPNFKGDAVISDNGAIGDKDGDIPPFNNGAYEIYNERQLFWFAEQVNSGENAINGKLMNDIDLNKQEWTAIGNAENPYSGTFDGGGFAIKNLEMKAKAANEGFFGNVSGGTVKSFTIYGNIAATTTQTKGEYSGLGVIGYAKKATVTEIQSCVTITFDADVSYLRYVGGIVGYQKDTDVSKCIWWGFIDMDEAKADAVGGIVGYNYGDGAGSITDCASYGAMKSKFAGTINLSGIIGYINNPSVTIKDCIFAGRFTLGGDTKKGYVSAVGQVNRVKELSNVYYEDGSAPNVRKGSAVLSEDAITAVTAQDLKNNAAVKLLNGARADAVWEQCEDPAYPAFVGMTAPVGYPTRYVAATYYITNADQLFAFAKRVNAGQTDICGKLKNDIDLGGREWTPIGTKDEPYMGVFDGNGFSIRNLNVTADAPYEGLFGYVSGGTVKDAVVYGDINIVKSQTTKSSGVGLIGYANKATISRIYSCLDITVAEDVSNVMYMGGIVGNQFESAVSECIWWGNIDLAAAKTDQVGGIVGYGGGGTSSITDCASYGTFKSNRDGYVSIGGILGYVNNENMTVANCLFAGHFELGENTKTKYCNAICDFKKVGTVDNVYCEKNSAPNVRGGDATLADDAITELEKDRIRSSEMVAYLNNNRRNPVWEQASDVKLPIIIGMEAPDGFEDSEDLEINNADQLFEFAQRVNSGEKYLNAKLMNDIDLGGREWTPIGTKDEPYMGVFDGNGFSIRNLNVTADAPYEGLFGYVSGGTVKDAVVYGDINIVKSQTTKSSGVGLIGYANKATISRIYSCLDITVAEDVSNVMYMGGIVGNQFESAVSECIWWGNIDLAAAKTDQVGGIVGYGGGGTSSITDCASYGTFRSSRDGYVSIGGILGYVNNENMTVANCLFAGRFELGENTKTKYCNAICDFKKVGTVDNVYCEKDSAPNVRGGDATLADDAITELEKDRIKSSEMVAYLNDNRSEPVWEQASDIKLPIIIGMEAPDGFEDSEDAEIFEIYNADQLFEFAQKVNSGKMYLNAKLMNDIDLGGREWTPIGTKGEPYMGVFDGNGFSIRNLNVTAEAAYEGLFGYVSGGTVKDVVVYGDINIVKSQTTKSSGVGLIGYANKATVSRIYSCLDITVAEDVSNVMYVGGIVGNQFESAVSECIWWGNIDLAAAKTDQVGGIVGYGGGGTSSITDCASYGTFKSNRDGYVSIGGILGYVNNENMTVTNCLFAGHFELGENTKTKYCNAICDFKKVGTVDNVYCEKNSVPNVRGGDATLADDAITELEKDQIRSSEMVAYLNNNRRNPVWEQASDVKLPIIIGMEAPDGFEDSEDAEDFEIYNADQLFEFAQKVNSGKMYLNAKLMNDIDLGGREWIPIGVSDGSSGSTYTINGMNTTTQAYRGSFDGNGKTIRGLKLTVADATQSNAGLFGLVVGGEVKNFTVEGEIQIAVNDADCRVGVIGWSDYATISGIESSVNITVADGVTKCKYVGGIVGDLGMCSTIERCIWYGAIDAGKCTNGYFAGIVGRTGPSAITNCASYGTLKNSTGATAQMHGVVGFANHADISISSCLFAGTMENAANAKVSAIASIGTNVKTPYSQLAGLYYEEGSVPNAILNGTTAATGTLAAKGTALASAKLSNGAAVLLLNGQNSAGVWKLDTFTIGGVERELPGFDGETITAIKCAEPDCDGTYQNGFCDKDPAHYEEAELVSGVYEIYNAGQLFWFAQKVNAGDHHIDGKLMNDIDLENREWTPIGAFDVTSTSGYVSLTDTSKIDTTTDAYRGSFDGNGKTVSGLKLTTTSANSNVGLFGVVIGGTIRNFAVSGDIRIAVNDADGRIGVIGQCDYTTVSGIESSVNITVADGVTTSKYVGGVVGDSMRCSTVEKCVWYGTIDAGKCTSGYFAGIVGRTAPSTITNCASYGTLKNSAGAAAQMHGIVGFANHKDISISNCLFAGTMENNANVKMSAIANIGNYTLSKINNLYYEVNSAANAVLRNGSNGSDGSATNNAEQKKLAAKVTALESAKLSNGEAVLLLNGQSSAGVWKLDTFTIGGERRKLPGFDGMTITTITECTVPGCDGTCLNGFCSEDPTHFEEAALVGGVYQIRNGGQLFWFAAQVNSGKTEVKAMLMADIELEENPWTPIGTAAKPFNGIFDGNGKTISGLNLTTTGGAYEGLFGYVLSSTIKNFAVGGKITVSVTANGGNLGVIGYAGKGTIIQKITSNVEITVSETVTNGAYQYIGGIVGNFDSGLLEKCVWDGIIDEGNWTIKGFAGIAGRMGDNASITNSASYGTLKSKNANAVLQGIVGWANDPDGIRSSLFAGKLLYEGTGTVKYFAIGTVGESCTAGKLTDLYYVNDGYAAGTPGTAFSGATAVTYSEATSRDMVWKLNGGKNSGNWRYSTVNGRPEFEGEQVRK